MPKLPLLLLASGLLVTPGLVLAQAPAPADTSHTMPQQPKKLSAPKWSQATVETVKGKLIGVWRSKQFGVVAGVDTDKDGLILCSVGPAYFVDPKITFNAGDEIEARGSRVTYNGRAGMLVSTLKRGDLMINVRTDHGKKLW